MSTTVAPTRAPSMGDASDWRGLLHTYEIPVWRHPQPGDVALCGHVKRLPHASPGELRGYDPCVVCEDLAAIA